MNLPKLKIEYDWDSARNDLVAGATVAAIAIPQAMAYALIAGVDPRFGLCGAVMMTIVASIFGSSSHLINGPTNAISLVVFSVLLSFDARFEAYQAMFLLGIMVGAIQILVAVFRLGDLTRYISESVVLGFMAGAGLLVAIGQVGNFLGVANVQGKDGWVLARLWQTVMESGPVNPVAIGLGAGTIVLVLVLRRVSNRWRLPQMDMLVGLIVASLVAFHFGWSVPNAAGRTMVAVVGKVPAALPSFHIPEIRFSWVPRLLGGSLAVSCLGLLEALAVAKSIATFTRQPLDYNRQCLAEGVSNIFGGFFQSLPGSGSLTRSAINFQAGGVTRMSGIYSGIIVGIVVLLLGPDARFIPKAALAGLLFITAARLIDWKRLGYAIRASSFDAVLVLVTAFSAIFISVEDSILIGAALSIILFLPRASKLWLRELIVTGEGVVRERLPGEDRSPSLVIYDLEGDLFFGAVPELNRYLEEIKRTTTQSGIRYVILRVRRVRNPDAVAIEHLEHFLRDAEKREVTVLLAGLQADFERILRNVNVQQWLPADRLFPEEIEKYSSTLRAVRYAYQLRSQVENEESPPAPTATEKEAEYYLV
jgi:SulP family sulfate permease